MLVAVMGGVDTFGSPQPGGLRPPPPLPRADGALP